MADQPVAYDLLQRFAATMVRTFDVNDMLYELGDVATEMLDAAGAGVCVVGADGRLVFVTATSEAVVSIEKAQERHQAGPCVEAFRTGEVVAVSRVTDLHQWSDYAASAVDAGFCSVVGLPLAIGDRKVGSLDVYDTTEREWEGEQLRSARVLADLATAYLLRADELAESRQLAEQLQSALDSRILIEQAKGMLARDHDVSVDQAFEMLRQRSRERNTPIRAIADAVVTMGLRLPPTAPTAPTV